MKEINDAINFEQKTVKNSGHTKAFYEGMPINDPSMDEVLQEQLGDITQNIQSIKRNRGWENDLDAVSRVAQLESTKKSKLYHEYNSTAPGKRNKIEISEDDLLKVIYVPSGLGLKNVIAPTEMGSRMQNLVQRRELLIGKLQKSITGIDVSSFQISSKGSKNAKLETFEMRKFEKTLEVLRNELLDMFNYIHQNIIGILKKAGYENVESLIKDLDALSEDDEARLRKNYDRFLRSTFKFTESPTNIMVDAKDMALLTKAGMLQPEEGRSIMFDDKLPKLSTPQPAVVQAPQNPSVTDGSSSNKENQ
jgi:hypothetical protein